MTALSGCLLYDTITVTQTPPISGVLGGDKRACLGDLVQISSGADYFVEKWSTGATTEAIIVDSAGDYYVDMYDLYGCPVRDTIGVSYQTPHTVSLGSDRLSCDGDTVRLGTASSATNPQYLWDDRSTKRSRKVSQTGQYIVAVTSGHCTTEDTVVVTFQPIPDMLPITGSEVVLPRRGWSAVSGRRPANTRL